MRVLFLSGHLPYPPISGGRRREYELLRRVARDHEVHVVAVSKTYDFDVAQAPELAQHCASVRVFPTLPEPGSESLPAIVRRHQSWEARAHLASLRPADFDLVHQEGFFLESLLPIGLPLPRLLSTQNVEHQLWEQRARACRDEDYRARHLQEARLTREMEIRAWSHASLCAAVTEEDRDAMSECVPGLETWVIPDGVDRPLGNRGVRAGKSSGNPRPHLLFVGNFAYEPNHDGALHLLEDLFPAIRSREPSARLFLVGNAPTPELLRHHDGDSVVVTGSVPSVEPYLQSADVFLCPLRVGGGVKVKMLEALGAGKAIVTTPVGAQGLGEVSDAFLTSRSPEEFVDSVIGTIRAPGLRRDLEHRARQAAEQLPSWDDAAAALSSAWKAVCNSDFPRN